MVFPKKTLISIAKDLHCKTASSFVWLATSVAWSRAGGSEKFCGVKTLFLEDLNLLTLEVSTLWKELLTVGKTCSFQEFVLSLITQVLLSWGLQLSWEIKQPSFPFCSVLGSTGNEKNCMNFSLAEFVWSPPHCLSGSSWKPQCSVPSDMQILFWEQPFTFGCLVLNGKPVTNNNNSNNNNEE